MTDWKDTLTKPIEAARRGVEKEEEFFGSVHDGPLSFNRIDYPAAQVYIENFQRSSSTGWDISVSTTLYFSWSRDTDTVDDILSPLAAVMDSTLSEFDAIDCINDYHPAQIDFFSGKPNNSLVLAVSVRWSVTTLIDPGDFAP